MTKVVNVLATVATLGVTPLTAVAGPPFEPASAARPSLRMFQDRHGLPHNTVHAIAFDHDGRLWVGTQDGAAVSNGRGWQAVDMPARTRSNFVRALLGARDGSMWFGTHAGGLFRLAEGHWEEVGLPCPPSADGRVNALLETVSPPAIWVATHGCGLLRCQGDTWDSFGTEAGLPSLRVWALHATASEDGAAATVWAGTEEGAAVLSPGSSRFVRVPRLPSVSTNSFLTRRTSGGEELWLGTYGAGVYRLRGDVWTQLTERHGLPSLFVTSLASHGDEDPVWVGTDGGGLAAVSSRGVATLDTQLGLPSNSVYALLASGPERGGKCLWIGTRNGGLARLLRGGWQHFLPGLDNAPVPVTALALAASGPHPGAVWFGTDGEGLARLDHRGWTRFTAHPKGLSSNVVQSLLLTYDERGGEVLWVGTRHGGLARLRRGVWTTFDQRSGALPSDMVQALLAVGEGEATEVWVGTRRGLAIFQHGRWRQLTGAAALPHPSVQALLASRDNRGAITVWVGTAEGLAMFRGGVWSPVPLSLPNQSIQSLQEVETPARRRELWVGSDGGGVARLDLATLRELAAPLNDESLPPLPNNVVYSILQGHAGEVYLLTNRGVARLTWRVEGPPEFDLLVYTTEDGLLSNQGNRGAGAVDQQGRIWVGTAVGAALFDPAAEALDRTPKPLLLRVFSPGSGHARVVSGERLPWRQAQLVFDYVLLSHFRETDTRYRIQLQPVEREPSPWSADFRREVGPLMSGKYLFRVWGRDYAGNVTGPQEFAFTVLAPLWRRWWAILIYVLLAAGIMAGMMVARSRTHRRREQALSALVAARTRELEDANALLSELSYLDSLTNIANRRRFDERLAHEWRRALRGHTPLSLIMVDIDYFKEFNDAWGHQRGDECLRRIATALADGLPRAGDSVARYGGEEFAVILPLSEQDGAVKLAETLRRRVEELQIPHPTSAAAGVVTISCGVATVRPSLDMEPGELVRHADEALYQAKQGGRNRTVVAARSPRRGFTVPGPTVV